MNDVLLNKDEAMEAARKELADLDEMRLSKMKIEPASRDYKCNRCSNGVAQGSEVIWVRTKHDEIGVAMGGSEWKSTPWHRPCWDEWEAVLDQRRVELEKILGEDHHEFDA